LNILRFQKIAIGCLFVATKTEEQKRNIREIITVFDRVLKLFYGAGLEEFSDEDEVEAKFRKVTVPVQEPSREVLERVSDVYGLWKHWIFSEIEMEILAQLGYKAFCELPHKYVLNYLQVLEGNQHMAQRAWNYLNDRY
jgi:hypothetical protein